MRVKHKYKWPAKTINVETRELIAAGVDPREGGQLETIEEMVIHLQGVVACLIDRAKLSDEDILSITRADRIYDAVKPRGGT